MKSITFYCDMCGHPAKPEDAIGITWQSGRNGPEIHLTDTANGIKHFCDKCVNQFVDACQRESVTCD